MPADPLREVLLKVVQERRAQIEKLSAQLNATSDQVVRAGLEEQIAKLDSERAAAQEALTKAQLQVPEATVAAQPFPPESKIAPQAQLLPGEAEPQTASKGPSKAALEAQIRELQMEMMDVAHKVQRSLPTPDPSDVAHLDEVREKLQTAMRLVGDIEGQIDAGDLPPKPTPSQQAEADNLIRQSRVAKMRGQAQLASDLLRKASEAAPGSAPVLEALGEDLLERGQAKPAAEVLAKARALDPANVAIERKYALAVARSKNMLSLEETLQMKLGDAPLSAVEAANAKVAAVMSFFIPGLGQIVLGDYLKGVVLLCSWILMIVWLALVPNQWHDLMASLAGRGSNFNPLILVPLIGALAVAITAAFTCKPPRAMDVLPKRGKIDRPRPPVDLPFE